MARYASEFPGRMWLRPTDFDEAVQIRSEENWPDSSGPLDQEELLAFPPGPLEGHLLSIDGQTSSATIRSYAFRFASAESAAAWVAGNGCRTSWVVLQGRDVAFVGLESLDELRRGGESLKVPVTRLAARLAAPVACPGTEVLLPSADTSVAPPGFAFEDYRVAPDQEGLWLELGVARLPTRIAEDWVASQGASVGRVDAFEAGGGGPVAMIALRFSSPEDALAWAQRGCDGGATLVRGKDAMRIVKLTSADLPSAGTAAALDAADGFEAAEGWTAVCRRLAGPVWGYVTLAEEPEGVVPLGMGLNGPFSVQEGGFHILPVDSPQIVRVEFPDSPPGSYELGGKHGGWGPTPLAEGKTFFAAHETGVLRTELRRAGQYYVDVQVEAPIHLSFGGWLPLDPAAAGPYVFELQAPANVRLQVQADALPWVRVDTLHGREMGVSRAAPYAQDLPAGRFVMHVSAEGLEAIRLDTGPLQEAHPGHRLP